MATCAVGGVAAVAAVVTPGFWTLLFLAGLMGGAINPLYSLVIAHTNDFLEPDQMAGASGGLLFLNGAGAVGGPLAVGFLMNQLGPQAFFLFIAGVLGMISLYGLYRMTQRAAPSTAETGPFAPVSMTASPVALEATQEYLSDKIVAAESDGDGTAPRAA